MARQPRGKEHVASPLSTLWTSSEVILSIRKPCPARRRWFELNDMNDPHPSVHP
jgi:hypothetical protein